MEHKKRVPSGRAKWIALIAIAALCLAIPFTLSGYPIRLATTIIMYVAFSQLWNILGGFAGYISLGLVGFIGTGAYATAIFMNLGINVYLALILAGLVGVLIAVLIGLPVLRLRAGYYSIATYAVAYILREVANNLNDLTGGGSGLAFPLIGLGIEGMNRYFYFSMLVLALIVTFVCWKMSRSSLGYGLQAIKEDEDAANVLGINTTIYKLIGFAISAFFAAAIGGMYGYWLTFIDPLSAYDSNMSIMVIIMAMVGGAGTVLGPIIGGVLISLLSEVLWSNFLSLHQGILGVILILVVVFLPKGIMDLFLYRDEKLTLKGLKKILGENIAQYRI